MYEYCMNFISLKMKMKIRFQRGQKELSNVYKQVPYPSLDRIYH